MSFVNIEVNVSQRFSPDSCEAGIPMKKDIDACLLSLLAILFGICVASESVASEFDIEKLLLPFSTFAEYEESTGLFWGRLRENGLSYIASGDTVSGQVRKLCQIDKIDGWPRGLSALDTENRRLYFEATRNGARRLFGVDLENGDLVCRSDNPDVFLKMSYSRSRNEIYGLERNAGKIVLSALNPESGEFRSIHEFSGIESVSGCFFAGFPGRQTWIRKKNARLKGLGVSIRPRKREVFFFLGRAEGEETLFSYDLKTRTSFSFPSYAVKTDEFGVFSFGQKDCRSAVFTSGVQLCVAVAGFDPKENTGFIGHFSPKFAAIEKAMDEIQARLNESGSGLDAETMDLTVLGGVADMADSVKNVQKVYSYLSDKYGISADSVRKFHPGASQTVLIILGEVVVF